MLLGLRHRAQGMMRVAHIITSLLERTPECLEQVRQNTECVSALAFSLTLQAALSRMDLPAL